MWTPRMQFLVNPHNTLNSMVVDMINAAGYQATDLVGTRKDKELGYDIEVKNYFGEIVCEINTTQEVKWIDQKYPFLAPYLGVKQIRSFYDCAKRKPNISHFYLISSLDHTRYIIVDVLSFDMSALFDARSSAQIDVQYFQKRVFIKHWCK